jgi:hypothetical protein
MVGVDVQRNLYGNLHDFFHDTRARYTAIGRTKLANIVASETLGTNAQNVGTIDDEVAADGPSTSDGGDGGSPTPIADAESAVACGKGCSSRGGSGEGGSNRAEVSHPGRCLAFVGDSGQGDELVARGLLGDPGS